MDSAMGPGKASRIAPEQVRAELARAGRSLRRAVVAAVVEQADHPHVGIALVRER